MTIAPASLFARVTLEHASAAFTALLDHVGVVCPSCPTQQAARALFFTDDLLPRLGGVLGPFVVTAGLIGLFVSKLGALERRRGAPLETEDES